MGADNRNTKKEEVLAKLKSVLAERNLTHHEFASLIGKKDSAVSRWLSAGVGISRSNQIAIEQALGEPLSKDSSYQKVMKTVKLGLIGTGNYACRFVYEAQYVSGVDIVAAYNPDVEELHRFCDEYGITDCSTIDDLYRTVDVVYIASPISTHYQYAKTALLNGCHVLCEVPFLRKRSEISELRRLAEKRNLVIFPAIKTAFCPSFIQMLSIIESKLIGEVVDIDATVTTMLESNVSASYSNERLMDNVSYPLLAALRILGLQYKYDHTFVKKDGAKVIFSHTFIEYEDAVCSIKAGVGVKSEGSLVVSGTRGYLYVPAPWWKPDYFEVRFENPADNKKYFFPYEKDGLRYEIKALYDKINKNDSLEYVSEKEMLLMSDFQNKICGDEM